MVSENKHTNSHMEQASHWWVLLHSESATITDHKRFGEWVRRSPERIEAYLETVRLMRALTAPQVRWPDISTETLIADARSAAVESSNVVQHPSSAPALSEPTLFASAPGAGTVSWPRAPWLLAAAALVLLAVAVILQVQFGSQVYVTRLGEQRYLLLEDGSRVTLNTESRIEVELRGHRRLVRLVSGEALFQVAHDVTRPFDVQVGDTVVRAVGTQFDVDRRANQTTVTVVEGRVAVVDHSLALPVDGAADVRAGTADVGEAPLPAPKGALLLSAAERVVITAAGIGATERVTTPAATTSWTQRRLMFDHRPLSEVAQEFNRYNRARIIIQSEALQTQEVSGVFQSDDPTSFLSFLSDIPGIEVRQMSDGTYVVGTRSH
jgi:transmembrane sensor